jgi:tetratricopeptide (TPR) repeat protein
MTGLVLLAAAVALGVGTVAWFGLASRKPSISSGFSAEDPRRAYRGPFRNVAPEVGYVADERCADCHTDQASSFAKHPMGRSLLPLTRATAPPIQARYNNPFRALGWQFLIEFQADRLWHRRMPITSQRTQSKGASFDLAVQDARDRTAGLDQSWEVDYALGSGTHGCSYLTDRDGYLYQTPISWYSKREMRGKRGEASGEKERAAAAATGASLDGVWDLSPGFSQAVVTGRMVVAECLFCHANRAHPVEGSVNRYAEPVFDGHAIGCQRCHGPGELHVASRERSDPAGEPIDDTIVNPRHLQPALREAVCEQCHLQARVRMLHPHRSLYEYRPGLPLDLFLSVFRNAPGRKKSAKAVGHVEQMHESRCFQKSAGPDQLGCVSCHDPHEQVPAARRVAFYRDRCLQCHGLSETDRAQALACSLALAERRRRTEQDSCIDCHMPRYSTSDIPHAASTDHRILRTYAGQGAGAGDHQPRGKAAEAASNPDSGGPPAAMPLVSFYEVPPGTEEDHERDRAVAVVGMARSGDAAALGVLPRLIPVLDTALRRDPGDLEAAEARGYGLALRNQWSDALAAFAAELNRAPERELALLGAATAAEQLERWGAAEEHWRRAIAVNPWEPGYRRHRVLLLIRRQAWPTAGPDCDAWVRLDPLSAEARTARLQCLLATGDKIEARREFGRIEELNPNNLRDLQLRFERKLR